MRKQRNFQRLVASAALAGLVGASLVAMSAPSSAIEFEEVSGCTVPGVVWPGLDDTTLAYPDETPQDAIEEEYDATLVDPHSCQILETPKVDEPGPDAAAAGVFWTGADHVHVTRGQASGHGWWVKGTARATTAKVRVWIQARTALGWVTKGYGVRTIAPGTAKRANARYTCHNTRVTKWRSIVDVDLVGYIDTPERQVTDVQEISCGIP